MINLSGARTKWLKMQTDMINQHAHTLTVHYRPVIAAPNVGYDNWFNEGVNPNSPNTFSGTVTSTPNFVVTGIAYLDVNTMSNDTWERMRVGYFEAGTAVFTCLISSATLNGQFVFKNSEYVTLSKDGCDYVVESWTMDDIGPYVYHIVLKKTVRG